MFCKNCGNRINEGEDFCAQCGSGAPSAAPNSVGSPLNRATAREGQAKGQILLENPRTGERFRVKVGWSWTLFLFSWVFGIPWFMRKIWMMGCIPLILVLLTPTEDYAGLSFSETFVPAFKSGNEADDPIFMILGTLVLAFSIFSGVKGNEFTIKHYIKKGYRFAEPNSEEVRYFKNKHNIS
jgi:hypothetical protein